MAAGTAAAMGIDWSQVAAVIAVLVAAMGAVGVWLDRRSRMRAERDAALQRNIAGAVHPARELSEAMYTTKAEHLELVSQIAAMDARIEMILDILRGEYKPGREDCARLSQSN